MWKVCYDKGRSGAWEARGTREVFDGMEEAA